MLHEGLWQKLDKLDPRETAKRANCQYIDGPEHYVVTLLNTEYTVDLKDKQIYSVGDGLERQPADFLEQLCILAYLINAQDVPLAGKLAKPQTLPTGQFFFRGLHKLPTEQLEAAFGESPELLYAAAKPLNAVRRDFGDASIEVKVLARIPLTISIWQGDEEFDARASILFDQTAGEQLPLDALGAAAGLAVRALVKADRESS